MTDLRIAVRREYFDDIKSGNKTREYRLVSDYWRKRLEGRTYSTVTITLGYPPKTNKERILTFPYNGYEVEVMQHKEFGPEKVAIYSIILEGKR